MCRDKNRTQILSVAVTAAYFGNRNAWQYNRNTSAYRFITRHHFTLYTFHDCLHLRPKGTQARDRISSLTLYTHTPLCKSTGSTDQGFHVITDQGNKAALSFVHLHTTVFISALWTALRPYCTFLNTELCKWVGLQWHKIPTKFHEPRCAPTIFH